MAPKLVCVSTCQFQNGKEKTALYDGKRGLEIAKDLIRTQRSTAHNVVFDAGIIAAEDPDFLPEIFRAFDEGRLVCTKIRDMIIQNAKGELKFEYDADSEEYKKADFSLARLVLRRLKRNIYGKKNGPAAYWRMNYHTLDGVPAENYPEDAANYAIEDSVYGLRVWRHQQSFDVEPEHEKPPGEVSQTQAAWALNLLGTYGVRTDEKAVAEYKKELEIQYEKQIAICQEYGLRRSGHKKGEPIVSRDMKAIRATIEKWYRANNRPMKMTDGGKSGKPEIATDREQLTDTDHPGLLAVAESVKIEKNLKTYIPALERGAFVPLNPSYNPIVETFRTSCSMGQKIDGVPVGLNIQNQPRSGKVRECIIPRPGNVFAFCDYDTLEMRTLAQVCINLFGFSDIGDAIRAGKDLHVDLFAEVLAMPYGQALDLYKAGDAEIENGRQLSKIGNYGLGGGMGIDSLVSYAKGYGVIISRSQASTIYKAFRRKWTEMPKYFDHISYLTGDGDAELVEGIGTGLFRGHVSYTALCNFFFQHLAAIGAKEALYQVVKECYIDRGSPLFGCRPWLFAHDEIGMEIPWDDIGPEASHQAAARLQEIMIEKMQARCPDVPIGATAAMSRKWLKGAKPMFVNNLLVPVALLKKPDGKKEWVADVPDTRRNKVFLHVA